MPCANVKLATFVFLSLLVALPIYSGAREYQPVGKADIPQRSVSRPAPQKAPAPRTGKTPSKPQSKEPGSTRQVKIPKFDAPHENAEPQQDSSGVKATQPPAPQSNAKLFGTVEFRRPLDTVPGWLDVIKRNSGEPIFIPEKYFNKSETWRSIQTRAQPLEAMEQLRFVNKFWNVWPYREDMANWGKEDYWAIPAQFLLKSGDCEDYAIAKYFTLKELGVDPSTMRIVVLRDTVRNLPHAVLAVYMNGDVYILDNLSNVVLSHRRLGNYSPQFSVNEFGRWTHIKGKPAKG